MKITTNIVIKGMNSQRRADAVKAALENLKSVEKVDVIYGIAKRGEVNVTLKKPNIHHNVFYKTVRDAGCEIDHFNNYKYVKCGVVIISALKGFSSNQ